MTKMSRFLHPVTSACGLFLLLAAFSCSTDTGTDKTQETKTTTAGKTPAAAAAPSTIDQVNVFLEVSGSMKGFMPQNQEQGITEFQQTMDPFLATIQQSNSIQEKAYYEVRDKPYPLGYDKMAQTVRYGIQQAASSTTIPAILDSIITHHPQGVNVLISDFIYSPENGRALSFVSTDIYRVLAKARQQGQAVSVFGATSGFQGTFYPAAKSAARTIEKCCDTPVPYYVWVIGPPDQVLLFNREVVRNAFAQELHAGFTFAAPRYAVLDKYLPAGNWYCAGGDDCREVVISDLEVPAEVVVGLALADLPAAFTSEAYLKQHLTLRAENSDARITQVYPAARFRQLPGVTGKDTGPLKSYTHFVKIKMARLNAPQAELGLQLARQRPSWVEQWTTPDDSRINQEGARTFNLSGIVTGLERAFAAGDGGHIFDIAITLRKEK